MRLIEASQYTVQPVIRITDSQATDTENPESSTYNEKQEAIASAFGSKKAKQAMAKRRLNQVCFSCLYTFD